MKAQVLKLLENNSAQALRLELADLRPFKLPRLPFTTNLWVQRDDLIHPIISGNKWRKLQGWVKYAQTHNYHTLLTFGGAYSNHLVATAAAGHLFGLSTKGILRGDEPLDNLYLQVAKHYGMEISGISRSDFRDKETLYEQFKNQEGVLLIPDGGQGELAFEGFMDLVNSWNEMPQRIIHASATATTAVGLAKAIEARRSTSIISSVLVLKNLQSQVEYAMNHGVIDRISFLEGYAWGGYAKFHPELWQFKQEFEELNGWKIDPVYTAKALYALREELLKGTIDAGEKIVFLHTGGTLTNFTLD